MAVSTPSYATREEVKITTDNVETLISNTRIDRAIQSASRNIEGHLHRVFYPNDTTHEWDWPNYQMADPWRLWFGQWDLVVATQVQSPPGTNLPLGNLIFRPFNRKPGWPYTYLEVDRSTSSVFTAGPTPQLSIHITGTWGFSADTDPAGALAADISSTSATTCTVSDGSQMGVGDLLVIDSERLIVSDRAAVSASLTQNTGCTTASSSDQALTTTGAGTIFAGEVILLDQERMLVTDITSGTATVRRAWDGTVLATHSGATVNAYRSLTILRGQLGTTAATHTNTTAINRHRVPSLIKDLAIAEASNRILQETAGYARTVGSPDMAMPAPGLALADLWAECKATYGRQIRKGAI